ncbi:MAG: hypothetical protein HOI93_06205 [Rhodobacteraceae bacterium]|jgi:hypothetical protein|nr:hypothetical protein [Paracoccaceae bacterium]MBT6271806.1 hypothetical protein [Paracoccaceae bacterium]MBT6437207.1 hypothetical protein [Paracoccaceae bacterium]
MFYSKTSISKALESYGSSTFEQLSTQIFLDTDNVSSAASLEWLLDTFRGEERSYPNDITKNT